MRCGLIVIVSLLLLISPALVTSSCDDVPIDHWSYDSLEFLMNGGFLPSAHMGQFDRNETLTNYDMKEYAKLIHSIFNLGQPDSISDETWNIAFNHAKDFTVKYRFNLVYTSYPEVPFEHWSYSAFDYLCASGALEGYPENFFASDQNLTRYEFAQAVARLLDSIGYGTDDEGVNILAEALRQEFSDQLAEINRGLIEANQQIQGSPPS